MVMAVMMVAVMMVVVMVVVIVVVVVIMVAILLSRYLMLEYSDCLNRCKRLAKSCDRVTASYDSQPAQKVWSSNLVMGEDVLIFLRWLVYHQHMTRRSTSFIAVRNGS